MKVAHCNVSEHQRRYYLGFSPVDQFVERMSDYKFSLLHCNTALPHRSGTGALWPPKLRKSLAAQIPFEQIRPLLHGWEAKRHQRELFPKYTAGTYLNKTTRDTPKSLQEINEILG